MLPDTYFGSRFCPYPIKFPTEEPVRLLLCIPDRSSSTGLCNYSSGFSPAYETFLSSLWGGGGGYETF